MVGWYKTVALALFVNKEKHENYQAAVNAIYQSTAAKLGIDYLSWRERNRLSEQEKVVYEEEWKSIETAAAQTLEQLKATTPPVNISDFVDHIDYHKKQNWY